MAELDFRLPDEAATSVLAARAAAALDGGLVIYLHGDLGAGKSSFARALLQAQGVIGRIKSPTYSLVESYPLDGYVAWHLDLYRIADPGELEWLGIEAMVDPSALVLVEWPEHGKGALPAPDLDIRLAYAGTGRRARLLARSARGEALLARLDRPLSS
jgi:tRNA threonylcarbamoyladenosine biosynthesis protein TsaE